MCGVQGKGVTPSPEWSRVLADVILLAHAAFVAFVVAGLVLIWLGAWLDWAWVRRPGFRRQHLGAIGLVVLFTLTGQVCPLTIWEDRLRERAGGPERYAGSFLQHWLHRVIYVEVSESALAVAHVVFLLLVLATYAGVPPRRDRSHSPNQEERPSLPSSGSPTASNRRAP